MSACLLSTSGVVGRLAPTPSGKLHLGNALSFAAAWLSVRQASGTLLLRVEDIDRNRSVQGRAQEIRDDLDWLGLTWDREVPPQRTRSYTEAMASIAAHTYRCTCTRREIHKRHHQYDGFCRARGLVSGALRFRLPNEIVTINDRHHGSQQVNLANLPDPKLVQRDEQPCYIAAVVVDDIRDGVTEVVRGLDLIDQIAPQEALWRALGAKPPTWLHAPILMGTDNQKLCKSHDSLTVESLRNSGISSSEIRRTLLPFLGVNKNALKGQKDPLSTAIALFNPLGFLAAEIQSPFQ